MQRWHAGSSGETVTARTLAKLMEGYREDGATTTRDKQSNWTVTFDDGQETRYYMKVTPALPMSRFVAGDHR